MNREEVLAAAREAFAERGFAATTLATIAGRLDVSPAALLRHAASKEELFAVCMAPGPGDQWSPIEFLDELDGTEDPREVLRRIAGAFVPFFDKKLAEHVAGFMHKGGFPFPAFAGLPRPTPPQRNFRRVVEYFERAVAAGSLRTADPEAAALALVGSLHAYVMLQRMVQVPEQAVPLERYLDTLTEIWSHGVITGSAGKTP